MLLTRTDDQVVEFSSGDPRGGGEFPIEHLASCEDLV